jgi:hypothetical protein
MVCCAVWCVCGAEAWLRNVGRCMLLTLHLLPLRSQACVHDAVAVSITVALLMSVQHPFLHACIPTVLRHRLVAVFAATSSLLSWCST